MKKFLPLITIFVLVVGLTWLTLYRHDQWELMVGMRIFMGYFFLMFALPKLMNLGGFADAYMKYDLIAMRSKAYALAYPFIELALAAAYLMEYQLIAALWITVTLMLIGAAGVAKKLSKGEMIQCACIGVVFKVPMTWVTLGEDLLMVGMATYMIMQLS